MPLPEATMRLAISSPESRAAAGLGEASECPSSLSGADSLAECWHDRSVSEDRRRALADYTRMADLYADDAAVDPIKVSYDRPTILAMAGMFGASASWTSAVRAVAFRRGSSSAAQALSGSISIHF